MLVHIIILYHSFIFSQITISEVMFDLDGADSPNEFIEIYNFSETALDLSGFTIADKHSTDELMIETTAILNSGEYALIFEGDYDGFYDQNIPPNLLQLFVDDSSIGNGLGNIQDSVFLINSAGDTLSQFGWDWDITPGHSIEKIVLDFPNTSSNWKESIDSLGTPGYSNSVSGFATDVGIDTVYTVPELISHNVNFILNIILRNSGLLSTSSQVELNAMPLEYFFLNSGDTIIIHESIPGLPSGSHEYFVEVNTEDDLNIENDTLTYQINVSYLQGDLLINEIMYAPYAGDSEWVEIINNTSGKISLSDWMILDNMQWKPPKGISTNFIFPGEFEVIAKDSLPQFLYQENFPSLNNSGDALYLFDPTGTLIDEVHYDSNWGGNTGISLERISIFMDSDTKSNWGSCIDPSGSTPNEQNSIFINQTFTQGSLNISPNPFSPDGDGFEDELNILYQLPFSTAFLRIIIYDAAGRKTAELSDGFLEVNTGLLTWDGKTRFNTTARVGQYILLLEAFDRNTGKEWKKKERIIVAKN
ncbi:MAG: lamin tail domain-containing protein [Candidatus Marinimicrobia bacterium]|nr:lamin tail domain-containing protein [Candidatus Neomarinimicrobiota bacterium]